MTAGDQLGVRADAGTGLVVIDGELTHRTAPALAEVLRAHLPSHPHLVLDVRELTFCDSSGLATLIGTTGRAERLDGSVTLLGVRAALHRLLRLTGVEPLFAFRGAERGDTGRSALEA